MKNEFDEYAMDYRDIHNQNISKVSGTDSDYFSEYKIREIYNRNIVSDGIMWLDLGCGDGNSARYINKFFPEVQYYGIDVSEESIGIAKKKNLQYIFCVYDGKRIPYPDGYFDVVYIACVMHHIMLEDRETVIKECFRVLKKNGKLIIFEHNPYNPVTRKMVDTCPFDENAVLLSANDCKKICEKQGFNTDVVRYTIFFPRKGIFNKVLLLEKWMGWIPMGGQYYYIGEKTI